MTTSKNPESPPALPRRPFAAKYDQRGWGIALTLFGVVGFLGGIASTTADDVVAGLIGGLLLLAGGIYLLRGRGMDPKKAARQAEAARRQTAVAAQAMGQATNALASASGGAAVVAYRNLEATSQRTYRHEATTKLHEALASIHFDPSRLNSPRLGVVRSTDRGVVEIFRNWIIFGQEAHDVDASTRGSVYLDGSVQTSSVAVPTGKKGKQTKILNQTIDTRSATLQFVSATWSLSVPIIYSEANEARRIVDQLAANVELLKPKGVTVADMKSMVDEILNNSGQPPAEKLKQLSDLRYERLLSDHEFEVAKAKILGI